jgi:hypothetical protein
LDSGFGGFFSGTLATIERERVRPRHTWWPSFHLKARLLLRESFSAGAERHQLLASLDALYGAPTKA